MPEPAISVRAVDEAGDVGHAQAEGVLLFRFVSFVFVRARSSQRGGRPVRWGSG